MLEGIYNFFTEYISQPISQAYQGSIVQSAVNTASSVLDYELYSKDMSGPMSYMRPTQDSTTVGGVLKGFAGGFLNIGQGKGGSGIYGGPYQAPPVRKINAPGSRAGKIYKATPVDLTNNFGFTDSVKANLYKASISDVPAIKDLVASITKNANRRAGIRTRLDSAQLTNVSTKTSMPYSKKPKYYG